MTPISGENESKRIATPALLVDWSLFEMIFWSDSQLQSLPYKHRPKMTSAHQPPVELSPSVIKVLLCPSLMHILFLLGDSIYHIS